MRMANRPAEGWLECRIFFIKFAHEQSPRAKELEALSWIPLLEKYAAHYARLPS